MMSKIERKKSDYIESFTDDEEINGSMWSKGIFVFVFISTMDIHASKEE